jgi:hypothetical protein
MYMSGVNAAMYGEEGISNTRSSSQWVLFSAGKACSGQGASLALDPLPRDLQFSGEVLKRKIFVFCGSPLEAQAFGEHKEQGWGRSVA